MDRLVACLLIFFLIELPIFWVRVMLVQLPYAESDSMIGPQLALLLGIPFVFRWILLNRDNEKVSGTLSTVISFTAWAIVAIDLAIAFTKPWQIDRFPDYLGYSTILVPNRFIEITFHPLFILFLAYALNSSTPKKQIRYIILNSFPLLIWLIIVSFLLVYRPEFNG